MVKTLAQLITGVRAAVYRRAPNGQVDDAEVTTWLNEDIREFWSLLAPIMPDAMTQVSGNITVNSGASTIDLAVTLTNPQFLALRGIDRSVDGGTINYARLKPWKFSGRSNIQTLSYRMIGNVARFEPSLSAPGIYRIWYLPEPVTLINTTDQIDLPLGGDKYVIQGVAARIRPALLEDPGPHLAAQAAALKIARAYFVSQHHLGDQETIVDVSGDYDPDIGGGGW